MFFRRNLEKNKVIHFTFVQHSSPLPARALPPSLPPPPLGNRRRQEGFRFLPEVIFLVGQNPMDANNWRPTTPGGEPVIDTGDWRIQLQPDSRKRIVDKIMETLKRHLLFSGQERLQELKKFTIHFEEKIYTTATNQSDYLHKISLEMLSMEIKSQNAMPTAHIDPTAWQTSLPLSLRRLQQVSKLLGINLSGYLEEKKKVKKTRKIVYLKDLRKEWKAKGYYQRMDTPSFDS